MNYRGMNVSDWYGELRHRVRSVYSFFIRGYYGIAPMDAWSLDRHVLGVLARGMRELARKPHGAPQWIADEFDLETDLDGAIVDIDAAIECWQKWLLTNAEWLEWYLEDDTGIEEHMEEFEKLAALSAYDQKYTTFKKIVLPTIMSRVDSLWD